MRKIFLSIVSVAVAGGLLGAQTLDEVLAKNYQARGGLDKLKSLTGWKMTGKIIIPAQGLDLPMVLWQKRPNKMRVDTTFQDKKIVQAFNGQKAWWIMPFLSEKAQEMPGEQGKLFQDQADFENPLVVYREKGYKLELLGKEELEGTPVFKLKLTKTDGKEIYFFLDAESGIDLKSSLTVKTGERETLVEIFYGDYKPVDGHMMPFAIENKENGQMQMQMAIAAIEINPAIEDTLFAMPEGKVETGPGIQENKKKEAKAGKKGKKIGEQP